MKRLGKKQITELEIVLIISFLILGVYAALTPFFNIDLLISEAVQSIRVTGFSELMLLISTLGNSPWIIFVVSGILLWLSKSKFLTEAYLAAFAVVGSFSLGTIMKLIVHRPRPDPDLVNVFVSLSDNSFPSNHVLIFMSFFGFLLYLSLYVFNKSLKNLIIRTLLTILILGVGLSRIFLGAHWASDVLGGYLLGLLWLIITIRIYKQATNS